MDHSWGPQRLISLHLHIWLSYILFVKKSIFKIFVKPTAHPHSWVFYCILLKIESVKNLKYARTEITHIYVYIFIFMHLIWRMTTFCVYCYGYGVGYTMQDIRYVWKHGLDSVGMSSEVELPQFRVLGHRQRATEINLTTGTHLKLSIQQKTP